MNNEILLKQAIELLQGIDAKDLEIVQIENIKYDDGSTGFNLNMTYPSVCENEIGFKPEISG